MELNNKIIIWILVMLLIIPITAKAGSISVELDCPASAEKNSEVSCTIFVSPSETDIGGIQFNYSFNQTTYKNFTIESNLTAYANNEYGVSLGIDNMTSKVKVGTLKIIMGTNDASLKLVKIQGTNKDYETLTCEDVSRTIRIKSDNNNLKELAIEGIEISPAFDSSITKYIISTDLEKVFIKAIAEDTKSSIKGAGNINVKYGTNTYLIEVTSESGLKKTYSIVINRADNRSSDTSLKKIVLSDGTIDFNNKNDTYDITVKNQVERIQITAEPTDSKANVLIENSDLKVGLNVIKIIVTAENETKKVYTLNVTRLDESKVLSDNNKVKKIEILNYSIDFKEDVKSYNLEIKNDNELIFDVELDDSEAKYEIIGNNNLKDGSIIKVIITSESGLKNEYTFNIIVHSEKELSMSIIVVVGVLLLILIICAIIFIKKRKINK